MLLAVTGTDVRVAACIDVRRRALLQRGRCHCLFLHGLVALFGAPATVVRPTALALSIIGATPASARFVRAGLFC